MSNKERYKAVNLCTDKVYGFVPDYWALVDTQKQNKHRAAGRREEMQFLADGLNSTAGPSPTRSVDEELIEKLIEIRDRWKGLGNDLSDFGVYRKQILDQTRGIDAAIKIAEEFAALSSNADTISKAKSWPCDCVHCKWQLEKQALGEQQ
jgi:hypothetical protein